MMELRSTNPTQGFESTAKIREARITFPIEDRRIQFGRGIMARPFVSVKKAWRMGAVSSKWWIWGVRM